MPVPLRRQTFWEAGLCQACTRATLTVEEERLYHQLDAIGINVQARGKHTLREALEAVQDRTAAAAFQRWAREVSRAGRWERVKGLVIEGPTGVGKSWLPSAWIRDLVAHKLMDPSEIIVDDSAELFGSIKQGYGRGTAQDIVSARKRCRVWFLDEFGLEHCTDDTFLQLTGILTAREGKVTVITCNVPRGDITSRASAGLADRVQSRFGERNFITIQMRGEDQRLVHTEAA